MGFGREEPGEYRLADTIPIPIATPTPIRNEVRESPTNRFAESGSSASVT